MATIRPGSKTVLLVVDVQVGVMAECWDAARVVANIATTVQRARAQGVPVVWVQHESDELPHGSPQWQWVPELVPREGEPLVAKRFNSGFEDSTLNDVLARLGATHVVLAGAETNWCIRATAYGALERGYDLTLVSDAHTATPIEIEPGRPLDIARIVEDLNLGMTWVRYPGRKNRTARAAELDFAALG